MTMDKTQAASRGLRILVVLEMGRQFPSGFLRGLIYKDSFAAAGHTVTYVNHNFTGPLLWRLPPLFRLYRYLSQVRIARLAKSSDVVYLCKVQSLDLIARLRSRSKARLVLDVTDAVWLPRYANPDFHKVLPLLDAVTADNEQTAAYVRRFNPNCVVVPDRPQLEAFDKRRGSAAKSQDGTVTLGWVGSDSTLYNLYVVWEALERLFAKYPYLHLRLLGVGKNPRLLPAFERVRYSSVPSYTQAEMIDEVLKMDIGIFPLQDVEASRVRGVLKAAVYMSGGAAAVCSPVGQCADLIKDGFNGMLAASSGEGESKLEKLIVDVELRKSIAASGLETVRSRYTLDRSFSILRSVLEGASHG